MKNKLSIALIFVMTLLTGSVSGIAVFLENHYGAMLNCVATSAQPSGQNVGNNVRIFLGNASAISTLFVRTVGYLSYGPSVSLSPYLMDIKNQQAQHSNDDAIIIIGPSGYMSNWNVSLTWEPKGKSIKPFEDADFPSLIGVPKINPNTPEPIQVPAHMINSYEQEEAMMNLNSADQRLDAIKRGALGADYAKKATEVCSANYTTARKLGKIDLCAELKRNLMAPVYRIDKRVAKKEGFVSPDLAPAVDDIKSSITRMHNALAGYKARGEAS